MRLTESRFDKLSDRVFYSVPEPVEGTMRLAESRFDKLSDRVFYSVPKTVEGTMRLTESRFDTDVRDKLSDRCNGNDRLQKFSNFTFSNYK